MPNLPPVPLMQTKLTYVDRPEISETYADSCVRLMMEGPNCKFEFNVNRFDDPKPSAPPTGRTVTACRLVLPLPAVIDLHAKLTQLIGTLQAQGGVHQVQADQPPAGKPN
jgi:hypothetical protein